MPKDTLNDTVDSTVDKLLENEGFQSKLADMIGGALAKAAEPAPQEKSVSQVVFETLGHHTKKPEIGNPLGAAVIAAYHGKGDPDRAARFAKAKWGNGNDVQKMFEYKAVKALVTTAGSDGSEMVQTTVADYVIEALRPTSIVRASGAQIVPNPTQPFAN